MKIGKALKRIGKKIIENKLGVTIGGAAAIAGTAGIVEPEVLELIPENLRGYAVLLVVVTLCAKALKDEAIEIVRAARGEQPGAGNG